jgi:cytochrome b
MAGGFILAWLTAEIEFLHRVHALSGAIVLAAALFRLPWGVIGSRHARFANFMRGPGAVKSYAASLLRLDPEHHAGHNPAAGWAILLLLTLAILAGLTGWAADNRIGGHLLEELHEGLAATMLIVVLVHLAGVLSASLMHGENLVRAMVDGHKQGMPDDAIRSARPFAGAMLVIWTVVAGCWIACG